MSFGDFLRKIGDTFTPPERIRDWRRQKRQYRAYLQDLGQDAEAVRSGVREWMKNNPKPKRTKKEKDKIYSELPELWREGEDIFKGNGGNGVDSPTFKKPPVIGGSGMTVASFNPLLLLLLTPLVFPKQFKKFFKF